MGDDAYTPRTTVDDSQFQGIINVYTTKRAVSVQTALPVIGSTVGPEWGQFTTHIVIARGSTPRGNNHKDVWIQHLHVPATFAEQDAYNFSKDGGDTMSRFYVMKRADYKQAGYAATIPVAGTPDTDFAAFVFATESVSKIGSDPNSIFVAVQRIYLLSPKVRRFYDDELDADVTESTEVVPRNSVNASSGGGISIESLPGSEHHDLKITSTIDGDYSTPRQLISIPGDANYPFPALLRGVNLVAAWAWANSQEAAPAYDEAYAFVYDIVKPNGGPYETQTLRFLTTSPDSLRQQYPIGKLVTGNDSIFICRAKAMADNRGNTAFAETRQLDIPETIHGEIIIENGDTISVGQNTNTLAATPNFSVFAASSSMVIGYTPNKTRYGLYLIEITVINTTGIYNGVTVPFDTDPPEGYTGDTGANDVPTATGRPLLPTATISADNTTITGTTSPYSEVTARNGSAIVGRGMSDLNGAYSLVLDEVYNDPVALTVLARRSGVLSLPTPITTNDLSPLAPAASISSTLTSVTGVTEPGATVSILVNGVAQVATLTIPTVRRQKERLTVVGTITGDGDAKITVTWPGMTGSPKVINFAVLTGDDEEAVATNGLAAVAADPDVSTFAAVTGAGPNIDLEALVAAANEGGANIEIDNDTCTGLTPVGSSTTIITGSTSATITAAGTAELVVVSAIPDKGWATLTVPFAVDSGDLMDDVATKGAMALSLSVANNQFIPADATYDISLTAREVAPNDPTLKLTIRNGTCAGITQTDSVITTPGGTAYSVAANASGNFSYPFSPALTNGDELRITASDAGGTSPVTVIVASSSPPTLASASFGDPTSIVGVASVGAKVIVYLGNDAIGDDIADGSGNYTITLSPGLIRGESVRVVATDAGNVLIRSAAITITAAVIALEKPVFTQTSIGYVGTLPAGADDIVIYPENDPGDETMATVHPNGNFVFNLPADLGENGERWAVVARYPEGDSDPIWFYAPTINLGPLKFELAYSSTRPGGTGTPLALKFYHYVWIKATRPGMVLTLSYPGSGQLDTVVNVADFTDFTIPAYTGPTWPHNQIAAVPRFGAFVPVYDTALIIPGTPGLTGEIPVPLVVATLVLPDGRTYSASFDRGTFKNAMWTGTKWTFAYTAPLDFAATHVWRTAYP